MVAVVLSLWFIALACVECGSESAILQALMVFLAKKLRSDEVPSRVGKPTFISIYYCWLKFLCAVRDVSTAHLKFPSPCLSTCFVKAVLQLFTSQTLL